MRILVTAGPTREYFDTVRFISNPSSGKMGYAVASVAATRGHDVVLVSGPVALTPPAGVRFVSVVSAAEMYEHSLAVFEGCDAAVMTAAVCDYRPSRRLDHKLKKRASPRPITLVPTRDIAAELGRTKGGRVVVGFAMEDHDHHANAEAKLHKKRCDAMVLNGIGNVGSDQAEVEILRAPDRWSRSVRGTKAKIALIVVGLVEALAGDRTDEACG